MAFVPPNRRTPLTLDDVRANHGEYNGRGGTSLSILGSQFDQRRREQYDQDAAQQPGYSEFDRARDMGTSIRNQMDSAGPWGGFFGRVGAQAEEANLTGKNFSMVGKGTPMPGYSGGGGGNMAALRAQVGGGGGGLDPRIERDSTALILKQLEQQLAGPRHGSPGMGFNGQPQEDILIDPNALARQNTHENAMSAASTGDQIDRQYGNSSALRHALTAEDVAGIKAGGEINRYMLPGMDYIRQNDLDAKTAPVRLQGESNERIAAGRNAMDQNKNDTDLATGEMQYRSSAMQELVKLLQGYQEGAPVSPDRIKDPNVKGLLDFIMKLAPGGR
jgi:hypothetical protein